MHLKEAYAIAAMIESRNKLAAWSQETGICKRGDLTQLDEQIAAMCGGAHDRLLAKQQAEDRSRGRERER